MQFIRAAALPRRLLFINLDETAVCLTPRSPCGLLVRRRHWGSNVDGPHIAVSKSDLRSYVTYVSLITSCKELQRELPHFVIGNKSLFTLPFMRAIAEGCPEHVHVWRAASSWTSSHLLMAMMRLISLAVDPFRWQCQPVLVLDVAPSHLGKEVMLCARDLDLTLAYVPARCTWLLQPLDVAGFAAYKQWLRREYQILRQACAGKVSKLEWAQLLLRGHREFWSQRTWAHAFRLTGCTTEGLHHLSKRLQHFKLDPEEVPSEMLSEAESRLLWPRNRAMSYAHALLFDV